MSSSQTLSKHCGVRRGQDQRQYLVQGLDVELDEVQDGEGTLGVVNPKDKKEGRILAVHNLALASICLPLHKVAHPLCTT